jgi:predicted RNA-binding Zn-ribbon protein involved in translation (DUF1610 family)
MNISRLPCPNCAVIARAKYSDDDIDIATFEKFKNQTDCVTCQNVVEYLEHKRSGWGATQGNTIVRMKYNRNSWYLQLDMVEFRVSSHITRAFTRLIMKSSP